MASVGVDSYTLKMIEQVTGPLRAVEKQVERTAGALSGLQKVAMVALAGGAIVGGIKLMTSAIGGMVSVLERGVGVARSFGSAIVSATMFRQKNLTALNVLLGDGKGTQAYNGALRVGGMTSASESDVVENVRKLAAAGYSGGNLNRVNAALLDVQGLSGNEGMNELSYYFSKFKGGLGVEADDIRRSAQLAGIDERTLMSSALGVAGMVPASGDVALKKQVDDAKKAGRINGEVMVEALLQSIKGKLDQGGPLGSFAKKMGQGTLAGLMSNLEEAPQTFLRKLKLEDFAGVKSLMAFIQRILVFFDLGTEQGKQLARVVEDITNSLFGGLDKIDSKTLLKFFDSGIVVAKQLVKLIDEVWGRIGKILNSPDPWRAIVTTMQGALQDVGALIAEGMIIGMRKAMPALFSVDRPEADQGMAEVRNAFSFKPQAAEPGAAPLRTGDFFGKIKSALGFKTDVKIENLNVGAGVTQEEGRAAGNAMAEGIRNSNLRTGAQPAPAQ